jgi:hypothetical protein
VLCNTLGLPAGLYPGREPGMRGSVGADGRGAGGSPWSKDEKGRAFQPGLKSARNSIARYSHFTRQNIGDDTLPSDVWNTPGVTVLVSTRVQVLNGAAASVDCNSTNCAPAPST